MWSNHTEYEQHHHHHHHHQKHPELQHPHHPGHHYSATTSTPTATESGPSSSSYPASSANSVSHDTSNTVYQYPYADPAPTYPDHHHQHNHHNHTQHPHVNEHQPNRPFPTNYPSHDPGPSLTPAQQQQQQLPPPIDTSTLIPHWMHHPYAPNAGPSSSSNSNSNSNHGYGQQGGGRMGSTSSAGWQTNPASHSESNMGYQQPGSYGGLPSYANHSSASSGYGGAKGKLRESSGSFADYERDFKRSRVESEMPIDVERETEQIKVYLTQLISLIEPFAPNSTTTAPSPPPPYLFTRFARLSSLIHSTLVALAPHVHPFLSSEFTTSFVDIIAKPSPPVEQSIPASPVVPIKKLEDMTPAEREMEVIRKRRDALIAKAASAATTLPSGLKNGTLSHSFGGRNGLSEQSSLSSMGNLSALTEAAAAVASASTTYPLHQQQQQNQQMLSLDMLSPRSLTLMGRCHGCGSSVTREWRRGPDGPESLCDTCGMHYARLLKKKDMPTPTGSNEEEASTPVFGMTNGGGVQVT